jgi:hypothetical protein
MVLHRAADEALETEDYSVLPAQIQLRFGSSDASRRLTEPQARVRVEVIDNPPIMQPGSACRAGRTPRRTRVPHAQNAFISSSLRAAREGITSSPEMWARPAQ